MAVNPKYPISIRASAAVGRGLESAGDAAKRLNIRSYRHLALAAEMAGLIGAEWHHHYTYRGTVAMDYRPHIQWNAAAAYYREHRAAVVSDE